jgi:putative membrane protein
VTGPQRTDLPPANVPGEWTRLHPLSPAITFGRTVLLILVFVVPRFAADKNDRIGLAVEAGILALGVVAGVISWLVTRWRVQGSELQIETGLVRRQSIRLPLARLQAIDVVRPLLARLFGLAELRVQVAGSGAGRGRLAYLPEEEANRVRARLLALAHGLHEQTPAPPEQGVFAVDNARLAASALLGTPTLVLAVLVGVALVGGVVASSFAALFALFGPMIAVGTLITRRVNSEFSLSVAEAPDGLRVHAGLLLTRSETIPIGRVQAVRWVEPLVWRPFGWCRLEVDVAQQRAARGRDDNSPGYVDRALIPVGSPEQARGLLARILPGVDPRVALESRPPPRARLKAPLSYPNLGVWFDDRYVVTGSGRLRRRLVVVPLSKAQSLRLVQGPVARRLRLATVHVDLVGRQWRAAARCRDADEAAALLSELRERARAARRASTAEKR